MKKIFTIVLVSIIILFSDITVSAKSWSNDGKAKMKANDCYGDSGYTSSFKNIKYYDVALPYKETCKSIGGYATKGKEVMSSSTKKANIGSLIAREGSLAWAQGYPLLWNGTGAKAKETRYDKHIAVIKDKNGIEYYVMAIQEFFYKYTGARKGFSKFDTNNGQLCDVILTDNTCIHFVIGDSNASCHTNGGSADGKKNYFSEFAKLNYSYYRNLYAASNGNCPEIWADDNSAVTNFREKYGLDKKVRIAYYRLYNKKFGDKIEVVDEKCKKVSYKLGASKGGINGDDKSVNPTNNAVNATFLTGCYTEDQISAFAKLSEANIQRNYLDDTKRSNLDQNSAENVTNWERNVDNNKKEYGFIAVLRKLIIFSGFFFIVWAILIYIAYWFDRINSIYCIDLLGKFTFNKLHISDTENECTFGVEGAGKKTVNHKAILSISLMSILIGVLVISGLFYKVISNIVYAILSFIKGEG